MPLYDWRPETWFTGPEGIFALEGGASDGRSQ